MKTTVFVKLHPLFSEYMGHRAGNFTFYSDKVGFFAKYDGNITFIAVVVNIVRHSLFVYYLPISMETISCHLKYVSIQNMSTYKAKVQSVYLICTGFQVCCSICYAFYTWGIC